MGKLNEVKIQILLLEAQKKGIESEMNALSEIRCPVCSDTQFPGRIAHNLGPDDEGKDSMIFETCKECDGSGYLAGVKLQRSYY